MSTRHTSRNRCDRGCGRLKFHGVTTDKREQGIRMGRFPEIFGEVLAGMRKFRPPNTIAIPIVLLLLFIGAGILTAGYYVNKSVFHAVFEERESNKARNIHLTIESIVSTEMNRISSLSKILKNDTDIVYGLFHFSGTNGDTRPLKSAMSQIYPKMNLKVFVMTD